MAYAHLPGWHGAAVRAWAATLLMGLAACGGGGDSPDDGASAITASAGAASSPAAATGAVAADTAASAASATAAAPVSAASAAASAPVAAASSPSASQTAPVVPVGQALPTAVDLMQTARPMDVAIQGDGAFVLRDPATGKTVLSRLGHLDIDRSGQLINGEGWQLMGMVAGGSLPSFDSVQVLPSIPLRQAPTASRSASFELNLDARAPVLSLAPFGLDVFDPNDAKTYNNATSINLYDGQGSEVSLTIYFAKTGWDTWTVYAAANGAAVAPDGGGQPQPVGVLRFAPNGQILPPPGGTERDIVLVLDIPATPNFMGVQTQPIPSLRLDLGSLTQYGAIFSVFDARTDGFPPGVLIGFTVAADGVITLDYDNRQSDRSRRLLLARPLVTDLLQRHGQSGWRCEAGCVAPRLTVPGQALTGALLPGALNRVY